MISFSTSFFRYLYIPMKCYSHIHTHTKQSRGLNLGASQVCLFANFDIYQNNFLSNVWPKLDAPSCLDSTNLGLGWGSVHALDATKCMNLLFVLLKKCSSKVSDIVLIRKIYRKSLEKRIKVGPMRKINLSVSRNFYNFNLLF